MGGRAGPAVGQREEGGHHLLHPPGGLVEVLLVHLLHPRGLGARDAVVVLDLRTDGREARVT